MWFGDEWYPIVTIIISSINQQNESLIVIMSNSNKHIFNRSLEPFPHWQFDYANKKKLSDLFDLFWRYALHRFWCFICWIPHSVFFPPFDIYWSWIRRYQSNLCDLVQDALYIYIYIDLKLIILVNKKDNIFVDWHWVEKEGV